MILLSNKFHSSLIRFNFIVVRKNTSSSWFPLISLETLDDFGWTFLSSKNRRANTYRLYFCLKTFTSTCYASSSGMNYSSIAHIYKTLCCWRRGCLLRWTTSTGMWNTLAAELISRTGCGFDFLQILYFHNFYQHSHVHNYTNDAEYRFALSRWGGGGWSVLSRNWWR